MQLGFHFGFKKSKAYGLCGVMLAILFLGMSGQSAKADEMLSPTDTSSTLKESTDNHEASYSEVGVHDDSTSQMNLQSEKVLEEEQTSLADSSKIAVLTNSSVTTISYQEADNLSEIDQKQSHFLSAIKQGAMDGAKEGVLPSITAAQAILESGWGSSELAKAPNNNLFGIKDSEDWNGESVTVLTQEYVNGGYITVNAAFRKYASWNDSVVDHAKFFTSTEWRKNNYRKVVNETDYRIAAQELKNAGYATDPGYAGKLISLIEAYKLYEWDEMSNNSISTVENEGVVIDNPKADLAITGLNNATGSYDVVISNLIAPRGFKEVLVPTWSEKNGQDDIIWYKAAKQANGDYKVTVRSSNHKGDSGLYNSHVYLVDNDGKYIGLGGKQATLDITKTQGTLTIANNDKNRGTFDVLITNLTNPSGISGVVIPVWSEQNGQDDLVWHNATKQDDGSYKVTISASQHKWNSGKYIVHGYIVDASGKNIGFGATSADVVAPKKIGSASRGNYDVLNKVVYLDAGHGGYDPGASYFGISEKSLTLAIQSRVKAKLEAEGYQVVTTRTSDTYVDLTDRSRAANASESDIFVSIHINASGSSAAQGIETYYYQPYAEYPSRINAAYHANPTRLSMSDTLANAIQSSLINATGAQNQGVKRQTFAVLRETTAPAVLLELGFLSNPQEAARLNTSAYQETLANAIVAGIKSYYEKVSKV
ncbi:cell wall hydrolase [Streptococcus salivarius]|uniref:GBS Bsp-like repeat-containing protein n=4 Tax=Streptococcus salivarius TaxID=1304 RepID=UPI0005F302FA|nr:GBS Bsp-like repeat-containing protein [Streptococcus salivarius]CVX67494.1 cell wall hydrolase/autolysin [Streptococcus pneumoniae]ARI60189.1 cell wall hydrolase [Streptococcus salivarius]KJU93556.1 N-acetylmuramoyl-L-alanine amidase [Streptococcus salivarius]MBT0941138.1 GBS Bsp-like repeat-containing protein [Streptococcus salivarius]MBT1030002.1 GBS Bsp-like repeat-containing protein [Streptococcus salivarius]